MAGGVKGAPGNATGNGKDHPRTPWEREGPPGAHGNGNVHWEREKTRGTRAAKGAQERPVEIGLGPRIKEAQMPRFRSMCSINKLGI
jgi:hypothetical protein